MIKTKKKKRVHSKIKSVKSHLPTAGSTVLRATTLAALMTAILLPFLHFVTHIGSSYSAKYAVISELVTSKGACETAADSTHQASLPFLRIVGVSLALLLALTLGRLLIVIAVFLTTLRTLACG